MKRYIPSILTLSNLFLGCCAVVCAFNDRLEWVPYLVFTAGWFDLFDGMAARVLKVSSELGKELDSLADMVTFGFVPGVILYQLMLRSFEYTPFMPSEHQLWYALPGFLVTIFSAYRLAKFNIDTRQSKGFLGLATPACTMFFLGLIAAVQGNAGIFNKLILNSYFLYAVAALFAYLLVSEIPMFSAKANSFAWKDNPIAYPFLIFSIIILIIFGTFGLTICTVAYILVSLTQNLFTKKTT